VSVKFAASFRPASSATKSAVATSGTTGAAGEARNDLAYSTLRTSIV